MVVLLVLVGSFTVLRSAGALGLSMLDSWQSSLRAALAVMFVVTASAHWGKFPANLHAARRGLTIRGRKATSLPLRAVLQVVFIAALIAAAWRR